MSQKYQTKNPLARGRGEKNVKKEDPGTGTGMTVWVTSFRAIYGDESRVECFTIIHQDSRS
jgi:hypothetical protein